MPYFLAPFIGWLVSGVLKFLINYYRFGVDAKSRIGNGGFPSTHTTVMTTPTVLIGLNEGFFSPLFGLAVAVTFIIIIDATGLRIHVGKQAERLNQVAEKSQKHVKAYKKLRESIGHTKIEIAGGLVLGITLAFLINLIFSRLFL
jgi:uncharacterized protein